jgi:hypothetical protein
MATKNSTLRRILVSEQCGGREWWQLILPKTFTFWGFFFNQTKRECWNLERGACIDEKIKSSKSITLLKPNPTQNNIKTMEVDSFA